MYRTLAIATATAFIIFGLWATFDTTSFPHHIMTSTNHYKAPLSNADLPDWQKVPGSYSVFLRTGYSFEQHKSTLSQTIDFDLDAHTRKVFDGPHSLIPGQIFYTVFDISDDVLDAIRADPRVAMVECSGKAWKPEDNMRERPGGNKPQAQ